MAETVGPSAKQLFTSNNCAACHAAASAMVGPSIKQVADKYKEKPESLAMLEEKVKKGAVGTWGQIPMPSHPQLSNDDISVMVKWMVTGS